MKNKRAPVGIKSGAPFTFHTNATIERIAAPVEITSAMFILISAITQPLLSLFHGEHPASTPSPRRTSPRAYFATMLRPDSVLRIQRG